MNLLARASIWILAKIPLPIRILSHSGHASLAIGSLTLVVFGIFGISMHTILYGN